MADKRTYTIEIQGLKESYEGVKNLSEVLSSLNDTTVKVASAVDNVSEINERVSESTKERKKATDQLEKAQQKLAEYDEEYQKQLAEVNNELSSNKKAINEQIKVQEAQKTVEAGQLDTYRDKQKYLTALNTLIRNHSTETDADKEAIGRMVQESAKLQQELKDFDENMKIYTRNVGNYPGAANMVINAQKNMKKELRETTMAMAEMIRNGVSKTDQAYLELAKRAGEIKDAIQDANAEIKNFASDTQQLDNAINLAQTATAAYGLYTNALTVFGDENEELAKSMQKMMAVMSTLQSLQTLQNNLTSNGSATARLYSSAVEYLTGMLGLKTAATTADTVAETANTAATTASTTAESANAAATTANTAATTAETAATSASTVAKTAATVATKALSVAIRSIPLMFVIGLVISLIQYWDDLVGWFTKTFPILGKVSDHFKKTGGMMNTLKAVCKGLGEAIINWVVNPFKTMAEVIKKVLEGDFKGAMQAGLDGIKNQYLGTVQAMADGYKQSMAQSAEEVTLKNLEETNKQTKQQLEELKIQERNNKTYSKKYIDLQKKDFEERKKLAKGNQEELNKIKLEEMKFAADCEDKMTAAKEAESKKRADIAKKGADEAKKRADEYKKYVEQLNKDIEKTLQEVKALSEKNHKEDTERLKKQYDYGKKIYHDIVIEKQSEVDGLIQHDQFYSDYLQKLEKKLTDYKAQEAKKRDAIVEAELQKEIEAYKEKLQLSGFQAIEAQAEYKRNLALAQTYYVMRKRLNVQTMLEEADDTKELYESKMKELKAHIAAATKEWEKASGENKKVWESQLDDMNAQLDILQKEMRKKIGYLVDEDVQIPIELDFQQASDLFDKFKELLDIKFEKADVVDMLLGNTTYAKTQFANMADEIGNLFNDLKATVPDMTPEGLVQFLENLPTQIHQTKQLIKDATEQGIEVPQHLIETNNKLEELNNFIEQSNLNLANMGVVLSNDRDETNQVTSAWKQLAEIMSKSKAPDYSDVKEEIEDLINKNARLLTKTNLDLQELGTTAQEVGKEIFDMQQDFVDETNKAIIENADKTISSLEKTVDSFQKTYQNLKLEPAERSTWMVNLNIGFEQMLVSLKKSREHYQKLEDSIQSYRNMMGYTFEEQQEYEQKREEAINKAIKKYGEESEQVKKLKADYAKLDAERAEGQQRRDAWEQKWQAKLEASKRLYGENSEEYKQAINDYKTQLASMTVAAEQADETLRKIRKNMNNLGADYFQSLHDSIEEVSSAIQDNLFQPLADGFSALFEMQLEEMEEHLEELEEMYDKAVELRQESQQRIAEINQQLRNDNSGNTEHLKQQLADEQVLLVQRQQEERELQKQKEREEAAIQKKEKQMRKLELSQKLVEGIVNTALGVTSALKYGPILGPIFAAVIGAMGALQTGIIIKQMSKLEKGGIVKGADGKGKLHSQGGHRIEGTNIEVEYGEWVINRKSSKKYGDLLDAINSDDERRIDSLTNKGSIVQVMTPNGLKDYTNIVNNYTYNTYNNYNSSSKKVLASSTITKFATGGQFDYGGSVEAIEKNSVGGQLQTAIGGMDFNPVVSVVDIQKKSADLTKVRDLAGK